ncbi:hypothetical protein HELRODRAFT_165414 [Helobdella robusta]|uniref:THAP9-like helix-turn-helix domain-containing protein n=1 Tax=Helobdella robusta TaxID=6412 RepID=T1EWR1_HELRO|nr:hypothetical protein HELRODRAFT_165414 [Helobdella robusta]ESN91385.1 hypothetical protein HELRODRAFT_165414 [Helobdella robusta]
MNKDEQKRFALTLHLYSGKGYQFLKSQGLHLPHKRTLSRWLESVDGEPGLNRAMLTFLEKKPDAKRWVLRSSLNFASDGEVAREVGREFQRKGPEKAKADLAKECLTRVKKREQEDDRKPGRLEENQDRQESVILKERCSSLKRIVWSRVSQAEEKSRTRRRSRVRDNSATCNFGN